jgi:hypothetical protein
MGRSEARIPDFAAKSVHAGAAVRASETVAVKDTAARAATPAVARADSGLGIPPQR